MTEQKINMKITKVTVFQQSAQIKMEGQISCEQGINEIFIPDLSKFLQKDSVRVRGRGKGRIENIIVEKSFSEQSKAEKLFNLNKELENLKKKRMLVLNELNNMKYFKKEKEIAYDRFVNEYPKYYSLNKIEITNIEHLETYLMQEIRNISAEILAVEIKLKELDKKIEKIQRDINQVSSNFETTVETYYTIKLVLNAEEKGEFFIEITYMLENAWWEPFYDILIQEDNTIEIDLMANVYNRTLVDWNNVSLEISTATTTPVKIEKPKPFHIDEVKYRPPPSPKYKVFAADMSKRKGFKMQEEPIAAGIEEELFEEEIDELKQISAEISSSFGVQSYSLNAKFDIPSDKNPKPIPLLKQKLNSSKQYFWSVVSPERTLCNNKARNGDILILPGNAKVYVGDEFVGETYLDLIAPHQEFEIGERITYDIKVKKELKAKQKQKEGAFKGKRAMSYKYEIIIENLTGAQEDLILYDRIPHSISEKIKVRITSISDEPATNTMNVMKFIIPLKEVKNKKVISYEYEVISEKDVEITPPLP
ncbi:MAG: mucoidy inhibitor MuiA family protein [Promethearchaeota archaeon]